MYPGLRTVNRLPDAAHALPGISLALHDMLGKVIDDADPVALDSAAS